MATAPTARGESEARVAVRPLQRRERAEALARLRADVRSNLFLIDLVTRLGSSATAGEAHAEVLAAWRRDEIVGLASLRPTIVLEAALAGEPLEALLREVARLYAGLVRSPAPLVAPLWARLAHRGRRALVDRDETSLLLEPRDLPDVAPHPDIEIRPAEHRDLPSLVDAARASLREEGRPDPFLGDPRGFRRWVRSRLPRALVGVEAGRVAFVAYADVQLADGWLLQGVYTWPTDRRRGFARAGVAALCRDAFAARADHVQLSVVHGNEAAIALYRGIGFRAEGTLRTLVFV